MSEIPEVDGATDGAVEHFDAFAAPAPRPCGSCPYRRDTPSGIWHTEEYEKLRSYDLDTASQPPGLFQCHQTDADNGIRRLCAGWVGCHGSELLGLRMGLLRGRISEPTFQAAVEYRSPVPLFESGSAAADHGQTKIHCPGVDAVRAIEKIKRHRTDLT